MKNNSNNNDKFSAGFTLIELMVVIVILGILVGWVAPKIMKEPDRAKVTKAKGEIAVLGTAVKMYKLDNGFYPSTDQGLSALVQQPDSGQVPQKWRKGGYLEKNSIPNDPWGNEYVFISPGTHGDFDLISYGADGVPGGEEFDKDISNWDTE